VPCLQAQIKIGKMELCKFLLPLSIAGEG